MKRERDGDGWREWRERERRKDRRKKIKEERKNGSSLCGLVIRKPIAIHEDVDSIPGLTQ